MGRRPVLSLVALLVVIAAVFALRPHTMVVPADYVFVNETSDHRFDESIRISIMAATKRTGVQNAVVILNGIKENDLAKTAADLFKRLEVGKAQNGRGLLYLFSADSKLLKIEVGYALEGDLPDLVVHGFERAAKTFTFSDRYQDFWAELINTLNIRIAEKAAGAEAFDFANFRFLSGGGGIAAADYQTTPERLLAEMKIAAPNTTYSASSSVEKSVEAYLRSLHDGIGDSRLDVLSEESRAFRATTPLTNYQLYRNWEMATKAGQDQTLIDDDFAFLFYRRDQPVLPIVLKNEGGLWRVHEPLSWALFHRFEDSMGVYLKFPLLTHSKNLNRYLQAHFGKPIYEVDRPMSVAALSRSTDKMGDARSLYFRLFWLPKVEERLAGMDLRTAPLLEVSILADTYLNLGKMTEFANVYQALADRRPRDQRLRKNADFYRRIVNFDQRQWRLAL